ncbi:DUF3010 family protein [Malaciobacter mytili]|uniref:DUF3010 family protein n=1 Tax=Malaciobacter mytili TaxID=603050 RepID=UPI003A84617E
MRVCAVELKSNNAILSVLDNQNYIDTKIKKISLIDDEKKDSILAFKQEFEDFIQKNNITQIVIKKRAKKGTFAGGAITFKMEAIIQLILFCEVELISSQTISSYEKKNSIIFPKELKKYQEQSYLAGLCFWM